MDIQIDFWYHNFSGKRCPFHSCVKDKMQIRKIGTPKLERN